MDRDELRLRTKQFALRIMRLCRNLPHTPEARVVLNQILRSAASVAANYRAACRSRSRAEFLSRLAVVLEEADETLFWLELMVDGEVVARERLADLMKEGEELVRIFLRVRTNAACSNPKSKIPNPKFFILR